MLCTRKAFLAANAASFSLTTVLTWILCFCFLVFYFYDILVAL